MQRTELNLATHQRRFQPGDTSQLAGRHFGGQHAVDADELRLAFDLNGPQRLGLKQVSDELVGFLGDEDRPWLSRALHARRQVHCVAHGRVLYPQVRAYLPHHHQPGVDTHPHVKAGDVALPLQAGSIRFRPLDDLQRGAAGTLRVVLVGDGCPKEGQDGVAHQTDQGALVAVDGLDQDVKGAVHDLHHLLGVQVLGHLGEALDVGEEDGHHAAFAAYLAPRSQEPFSEFLGHQTFEGLDCHCITLPPVVGWRSAHPGAAGEAELGLRGQFGPALGTGQD